MIVEMNPSQAKGHEPPDSVFTSEIAWRAYDKWVERGRPSGTQVQDRLEAEAEGWQRREMARQGHQQETPAEIRKALFDAVGNFCNHQHQDDLTAVAIEIEVANPGYCLIHSLPYNESLSDD